MLKSSMRSGLIDARVVQEELRLCKERERKLMGEKQWLTELAAAGQ